MLALALALVACIDDARLNRSDAATESDAAGEGDAEDGGEEGSRGEKGDAEVEGSETDLDGSADGAAGDTRDGGVTNADGSSGSGSDGGGNQAGEPNRYTGVFGRSGALAYSIATAQAHAVPGSVLNYLVTVANTSAAAVEQVKLTLHVPSGASFSVANAQPPATTCFNATCPQNSEARWTLGTLAAGASRAVTIPAEVAASVAAGATLSALIRLEGQGVNAATLTKVTTVQASAKVEMALTTAKDLFEAGEVFRYSIDVGHVGDATVLDSKLAFELPANVDFVAASAGGNQAMGKVTWTLAELPVAASIRRWVDVKVRAEASAATLLSARASLTDADGTSLHREAERVVSVVGSRSPLIMDVAAQTNPIAPNGYGTYIVSVSNRSERAIDGASLALQLPVGASFSLAHGAEPSPTSCFNATCPAGMRAVWALGTLPVGASRVISFDARFTGAAASAGRLVLFNYEVSASNAPPLRVAAATALASAPEAQLALASLARPIVGSESAELTVDVGQTAAAPLQGAALRLRLPEGLSFESASDGGALDGNGEVAWTIGTFAVGDGKRFTVRVKAAAALPPGSSRRVEARLTYDGGRFERTFTSQFPVRTAAAAPALNVVVGETPNPVAPGAAAAYSVTLTNMSALAVTNVSVVLRMPDGASFAAAGAAEPDASCFNATCPEHMEASWTFANLDAGATQIITFNPTVVSTTVPGSLLLMPLHVSYAGLETPLMVAHTLRAR